MIGRRPGYVACATGSWGGVGFAPHAVMTTLTALTTFRLQLNDFLATITTEDGGLKDGSRVVKLLQRMVQSKSAYEVDKRERMLDILLVRTPGALSLIVSMLASQAHCSDDRQLIMLTR